MTVTAAVDAVLLDLLTAVMDSRAIWAQAAGSPGKGRAWRDAATSRMRSAERYIPYVALVEAAAAGAGVDGRATERLLRAWPHMRPWPDAAALESFDLPYAFVTNCSRSLAVVAARRSGLSPQFVLTAEEAGRFKPSPAMYREACRLMGTSPGRTAFAAGSRYDAVGARDAGLVAWLVMRDGPAGRIPGVEAVETLTEVLASVRRPH